MKKLMLLIMFFTILLGCENNSQDKLMHISSAESYDMATADSTAVAVEEVGLNLSMPEKKNDIEPKIIKNANLRYQTDNLENTYLQIQNAIKKNNATVQFDSENKEYQELSRSLTIRLPSANFDNFIKEISEGVGYFDRKEISSSDVTEEFIDVASRIKTKKVLENRYLELLKKANKVSEMLEIEKQLSEIREEIEAKEGRLNYLQNKVSLSTITINIYKPLANENNATSSYGSKLKNAILSGFNSISNFFVWLVENWPLVIISILTFIYLRRRFKKKIKN